MTFTKPFELTVGYGPTDNFLFAKFRVGERTYDVVIDRWGKRPEGMDLDAYDYLAREALAKARQDEGLPRFDRAMLVAFEDRINERRWLLRQTKNIETSLGANNL